MGTPFLAEIRIMSFNFPPQGWAMCDGQLLPINQNEALFELLGTTYGGDGKVNFGLPNLQGRTPIHVGTGHSLGERGGEQSHTLSISELPSHTHGVVAASVPATSNVPSNERMISQSTGANLYAKASNVQAMAPQTIASVGGSQAHPNMQPYLTLNFCISLQGLFPPQR
jgi:microcystin-dependent protein